MIPSSNNSIDSLLIVSPRSASSPSITSDFTATPPSESQSASIPTSPTLTTNTVEAATMGLLSFRSAQGFSHGYQFNQLFNYVNHIDEVSLEPGETQRIIIAFLPEVKDARESVMTSQVANNSRLKSITANRVDDDSVIERPFSAMGGEDQETYDVFEINGLLFLFAYKSDRDAKSKQAATSDSAAGSQTVAVGDHRRQRVGTLSHVSQPNPAVVGYTDGVVPMSKTPSFDAFDERLSHTDAMWDSQTEENSQTSNPAGPTADLSSVTASAAIPDYQLTIRFRSRVCRSVLWTDVNSTGLIFDDCIVGGSYFKDFTISNRSEIELFWCLNTIDLSNQQDKNWLKFSDYDSGEPIDTTPIPAYSYRRIRVTFKPREVGEFNYDLQIENQNDDSNTIEARIHAVVRDVLREETLAVSTGNMIDFGDCCAGLWRKKRIVLRNMSDAPLDVSHDETGQGNPDRQTAGQDTFMAISSSNSDFSPTQSSTSSRASSPLPIQRRRIDASHANPIAALNSGGVSGISSGSNAGPGTPMEPLDMIRASSNASNFSRSLDAIDAPHMDINNQLTAEEFTHIEELQLRPGAERSIEVAYRPERDALTPDYRAGRLTKRNFRITLIYGQVGQQLREKKTIQAVARTCTSFIEVQPSALNFGDTNVGNIKSLPIQIINCSDLPARVELHFVSKVLSATRGEMNIPAKQHIEVKVDIYPRKVNPDYRKQITVVNLFNRDNDHIVDVSSNNIDKNRVSFHSLFYNILTPTSTSYVDFGAVILNSPTVRTFTIENLSKKCLTLDITSSMPDEIRIFMKPALASAITLARTSTRQAGGTDAGQLTAASASASNASTASAAATGPTGVPLLSSTSHQEWRSRVVESFQEVRKFKQSSQDKGSRIISMGETGFVPGTSIGLGLAGLNKSSRHATGVEVQGVGNSNVASSTGIGSTGVGSLGGATIVEDQQRTTDYLDLASIMDGPGRRSPKRKPLGHSQTTFVKSSRGGTGNTLGATMAASGGAGPSGLAGITGDTMRDNKQSASVNDNSSIITITPRTVAQQNRHISRLGSLNDDSFIPQTETFRNVLNVSSPAAAMRLVASNDPASALSELIDGDRQPFAGQQQPISSTHPLTTALLADILETSRFPLSIDLLLPLLEKSTGILPPLFPRASLEEKYVKSQIILKRELDNAIQDARLVPVSTLEIQPSQSVMIVLVMTALGSNKPNVQEKPRKHDARIFVRLRDFDRDIQQPEFEQLLRNDVEMIPVRELMLRSLLYRSIMELGQKNINFGVLDKNERRTKSIVIRNCSESPLLYTIRTSGTIASGDIALGDYRMGVVRGHGKREVVFLFDPTMPGQFQEKLIVENIQDRENDQVMTLKANIRQPATFTIDKQLLEFGVCLVGEQSSVTQEINISNTSMKTTRTFEVRVDPKELQFQGCWVGISFDVLQDDDDDAGSLGLQRDPSDGGAMGLGASAATFGGPKRAKRPPKMLSKETEEQIDEIKKKINIAARKGRQDKVERLTEKLQSLISGEPVSEYAKEKDTAETTAVRRPSETASVQPADASASNAPVIGDTSAAASGLTSIIKGAIMSEPMSETPVAMEPTAAIGTPQIPSTAAPAVQTPVSRQPNPPVASQSQATVSSSSSFKVKKTPHSIIFTIAPRCIKTVRVTFHSQRLVANDDTNPPSSAASYQRPAPSRIGILDRSLYGGISSSIPSSMQASIVTSNLGGTGISDFVSSPSVVSLTASITNSADTPIPTGTATITTPSTFALRQELQSEECTARIYVHEQKNTDIVKRVLCKATVCYNHSTYLQLLSEADPTGTSLAAMAFKGG
eukprot:jgi/Hompol1/5645/HPOL_004598-RA